MSAPRFALFGAHHLAALAATTVVAAALSWLVRRDSQAPAARFVRAALAGLLLGSVVLYLASEALRGTLSVWDFAPLHLCDFLIFVAAWALLTRGQAAYELLYFWGATGALLAMVTPDVRLGFPDRYFLVFFGFHGAVVTAAAVLTFGCGMRPRRGAPWRAFLMTSGYAAVVGLVNLAFGTNFLYLSRKPDAPTLLDWLGPWPLYILACQALALLLFFLLDLPFRPARKAPHEAAA